MKTSLAIASALLLFGAGCSTKPLDTDPATAGAAEAPVAIEEEPVVVEAEVALDGSMLVVEKTPTEEPAAAEVPSTASFVVSAKSWAFEPATMRVKQGTKVTLTVTSVDVDHGFMMPAFNVNEKLTPGASVTVSFVADKVGEFPFFCNVFCGSGHSGMKGTLIVE